MEKMNSSYPVSFSQRLRETQMSKIGVNSSRVKSRASSLTAFERAKLMMRLRGGSDINDRIEKQPQKLDKKGGSRTFGKSGKYLLIV